MRTGKPLRMDRDATKDLRDSAKTLRGGGIGSDERMELKDEFINRESVAAHQAVCSCHEIVGDPDTEPNEKCMTCGRLAKPDAHDPRRHEWHIDPLCKVRPEARP